MSLTTYQTHFQKEKIHPWLVNESAQSDSSWTPLKVFSLRMYFCDGSSGPSNQNPERQIHREVHSCNTGSGVAPEKQVESKQTFRCPSDSSVAFSL